MFHLVNDVNSILELLPLQERMQVVEKEFEVVLSVSVGNDDGCSVPRLAGGRAVTSSTHHQRIFSLNFL